MGFSTRVEWKNFDLGFSLRANLGNYNGYNNYENFYDPDKYVKLFGFSLGWGKQLL